MCEFPFEEKKLTENTIIRSFSSEVNKEDLVWHKDQEDRKITIKESNGWKIQYDNQLPIEMKPGQIFYIKSYEYHRVLKGNGNLIVKIER